MKRPPVQRDGDSYRRLMEQVIAGKGLAAVASTLASLVERDAVVADEELEPLHCFAPGGQHLHASDCAPSEAARQHIDFDLHHGPRGRIGTKDLGDPPIVPVEDGEWEYIVAPVVVPGTIAGYVWIRSSTAMPATDGAQVMVAHAATACAVEIVRQRAMLEGELRVRNSFLEDLLTGRVVSVSATRRRARFLGYDLRGDQVVFVLDMDHFLEYISRQGADESSIQRIKDRFRRAVEGWVHTAWTNPTMVWEHSDSLVVLTPAPREDDDGAVSAFRQRVETLRAHVEARLAGPGVSAGIGRAYSDLMRLHESYREAEHALRIGTAVYGPASTTAFDDLGVYRLLFHLRDQEELRDFCDETIGDLVRYDEDHEGHLLTTLDTYLGLQGNVSRAADVLHLHRNGLLYRLNRIQTLARVDLDNPTQRLALQLALLARPLLDPKKAAVTPLKLTRAEETA